MTSKKTRVTLNDELQSLVDNSRTSPAVLIAKLITDMVSKKYDKRAEELMKRRVALIAKIREKVQHDVGPGRLSHYWDHGAEIHLNLGITAPLTRASHTYYSVLTDYFKSLDNSAPRNAAAGMARILNISMFKKGPALLWVSGLLFHETYNDSQMTKKVRAWRESFDPALTKSGFLYGLHEGKLTLTNPNPVLRKLHGEVTYEEGGSVVTYLKNLDLTLFEKLETLGMVEAALAKSMYDDIALLAVQTAKVRSLEKLLKKMPDMLEHPDLKMLLGFNVNPQAERIEFVTRTMSGDAILNPTL